MNLFELIENNKRMAAGLAAQSASAAQAAPDIIGRAVEAQMLTGVAPSTVVQDPGGFQRLYQEQRNAGALLAGPITTEWMNEEPENAGLVMDEVPSLVDWELTSERLVREATGSGNISAAFRSWWLSMRSMRPSFQLANRQTALEDQIDYLGTLRALEDQLNEGIIPNYELLATSDGRNARTSILQLQRYAAMSPDVRAAERARVVQVIAGSEAHRDYYRDVLRDYSKSQGLLAAGRTVDFTDIRDLRSFAEWTTLTGVQGALDMATYAGLGIAGSAIAGPVGGGLAALTYGTARGFSGITAEQAIQDAPYTTEEIARARLFGALSGGVEVVLGPTARFLRGAAGRALTRQAYSEVGQEVLERVSQGYLRRIGREAVGSTVEEFFQEGAQYFLQKAGVEGEDFRWTDETLLEAFNAAMAGMVGGGIIGAGFGARQQIVLERISRELRDAGRTVQNMDELANVTQDLQLAQRSPTKFQQLAERLGLSRVSVFFQAEDLNTYFQSQNKDPVAEVIKLGGTADDFEAALASNGRISVTAEGLARAGLRGTDGDFLRENGSFTPAGSTPAEAQAINQTYNEIQQQIQEQSRMAEMAPERRQVYDAIYGQLRSAGRSQREAEANAALSTAFFETMAQRYGEDSGLDLYRRFGFRVEGPRQMARAEAAAEAAQLQIPDETVAIISDALAQAAAGGPVALPVTPEVTLALQTLGVPVDATGTISAQDAQRLTAALQALEDVVLPAPTAGPTFMQTATIRRGEEALEVPTEGRAPSTRKVAAALEGRQREQFGTIERGDYSDEAADRISDWAVEEVMFEVEQARANPERSAVGWYSEKFQRALDVFGGAFPELIGDLDMSLPGVAALGSRQAARDFFTALIVITSDGAKLADNFRFASRVMEQFRRNGRIDPNITFGGERNKSMQINLRNIQEALDTLGPDQMAEQLLKKDTISNLKRRAKEQGKSFSTAYKANMELPYAALVFGPKLGAFYANLMGDTGYLTMDRWWSRTFNRYRGTLLAAPTKAGMGRVKELIIADRRLNITPDQMSDDEALVYAADYVASYKAKDYKNGTEIEKAANTVYRAAFDQLEDQPFNASDREFMVNTTLLMQDKLAQQGVDLTVADIQAVLWYYEKRLYAELGARATADVSYEEIARQVIAGRADPAGADAAGGSELSLDGPGTESGAREPAAQPDLEGAEQPAAERTLYQRGITPDPAAVRGRGAGAGAAGGADVTGADTGLADQPDRPTRDQPVSGADLERLDDPAFLSEFLTRPGWGAVTASLSLPDTEFYRNQRENKPALYEMSVERQQRQNEQKNAYLLSLLEKQGIPYVPVQGMYMGEPDGTSYLIIADEATVMKFGRQFNQDSVLTRDGLIFTSRPRPDVPATGELMVGEQALAEDFYSVTPNGTPFSMGLGFGAGGPGVPVIPTGYTESPDRPQLPIRPDGLVELFHWSGTELTEVDPAFAGTGPLQGVERQRAARLSFFGINPREAVRSQGTGYVKESGLGPIQHVAFVDPASLYPIFEDPDGIVAGKNISEAEAAIREAGYFGYYTTDDGSERAPLGNVAALFDAVPVQRVDPEAVTLEQRPEGAELGEQGYEVQRGIGAGAGAAGDRAVFEQPDVAGERDQGADGEAVRADQRGRGAGRYSSGGLAPLEGAPTVVGAAGPDPELVAVAEQYAAANGIDLRRQAEFVEVDPERATRIAQAYEEMEHAPQDPAVQAAYADLIQQTLAQYQALVDAGYTFTFFDSATDPYDGNPWNAMRDLRANKTMAVYGTYDGYGTEGLTAELIADNPMLQDTGLVWLDQNGVERPVTANDLFRAVHDAFGHGIEGAGFRARGEENAWQAHVRLFTGPAIGVLTSETRGQNSWLNYGPFGEQNRTASVEDTVFAPQKAGIMPEFTWNEGRAADEALPPQRLEQRPEGAEPRGSITFPGGGLDSFQAVIRLFERADRSTFAHEAGHFFLEAFKQLATDPQAPQGMLDDFRTINEYLGRDPEDTSEYTVDQQETWARSFEAYIMEGKAPSIALRSAFERFKSWLTRIYRQVVNLQVELSPEIRDVMDRMLATEEEIALVKAEQEISPLFLERPTSMDEADYDRYRKTATEADDEASQRLMNKLMARIRLQRTKTYNAERKALMATVEEELRQTRTYQTVERLQTGETRLNRQQIVDQFGEEALRDMNREKLGGKRAIYTPGGADLSVMAELMGYDSETQMIEELRGAQKFSIAVELEVNKRLDQKYGDLLTDGSIKDAARAAMHSDKRGQLLTAEANQLRAQIEEAGGPTPPNLSREAIKQQARDMIQDMSVRQAASPNAFLRAERKAAGEAQRAFSRVARAPSGQLGTTGAQDLIAAHAAKRRQLLNHYLYVEARKAEELVAKMRKQSTRLQKKSTREAVASPYIDEIYALLEQYDFRQLSPGQVAKQQNLAAFVAAMQAADREGELAIDDRLIQRSQRTHFSTLTVDELQGLKDTLDNLEHLGRTKMKLLDAKRERSYAEVQQSMLRSIEQNLPDQAPGLVERLGDARKRAGRIALNTVLSADAIINRLDGSVRGVGDVWRALKQPISEGLARVQVRKQQATEDFVELFKKHYTNKERLALNSKMLSVPEVGQTLPKQAILAIALNTGNRDNFERLTNPDNAHSIPRDQVQAILDRHMDERDWRFVQDVWDYLDSYWPEIAAQERALTGVNPRKVDTAPQITPYSFVKGGYYPIRYDPRLSGAVQDYDHNQMMENLKGGRFAKAQTRNGHTKERVSSTGKPLRLDLGIAIAHINDVIYDLEMRQPVQNSWRLLNDPQIDAALRRKDASEDAEALKLWVQDTANGDRWSGNGWSAAYRHLRGGLSIAKMGFSITTLVQQPTGLLQSAAVVGKGPLSKALWKYKNNPLRNAAAVRAMSLFMEERQQTFQRDLSVLTESMAEDPTFSRYNTFKQVMSAAAFYLIQKAQFYIVDVPTWMAAYDTELRKNGGDADAAALVADQIVARAQGSGLLSDRTAFERGTLGKDTRNVELAKLMTTFGSYMMAKFSVATQRVRGTDLKNPAEFVSLLVDLLMLYTIETALAVFLTGNWPDFEEEEQDPLLLFLAKETGLSIMSGLPLAREAASTLEGFGGGGTLAAAIEESAGLFTGAYRMGEIAVGLEDEDRARAALKDVLGGMGVLFQLPTIQLERTLDGMFDDDMQFRDDFTAMDLLLGRRAE